MRSGIRSFQGTDWLTIADEGDKKALHAIPEGALPPHALRGIDIASNNVDVNSEHLLGIGRSLFNLQSFTSANAVDGDNTGQTLQNPIAHYYSGTRAGYNIDIRFSGDWTAELQQAFIDSSEKLSKLIAGDVANVYYGGRIIDDIRINASLQDIDGVNGILGQAGPTAIRSAGYLPATAVMAFDRADADALNKAGLWDKVILHEMIHSVGFGSIWKLLGLLSGAGTENPMFTGGHAIHAYEHEYGVSLAHGVPVEHLGGAGTRDSHWDEKTFGSELMTGYLNPSGNFLSGMTIASLHDLGYDTTFIA